MKIGSQGFLLDTNVISELGKRRPHAGVLRLFSEMDDKRTFLSVVTYGELRKGLIMAEQKGAPIAAGLSTWMERILNRFQGQFLPVDRAVMDSWAEFCASRARPVEDMLIAGTAHVHKLALVTRNTGHFTDLPLNIVNPWQP